MIKKLRVYQTGLFLICLFLFPAIVRAQDSSLYLPKEPIMDRVDVDPFEDDLIETDGDTGKEEVKPLVNTILVSKLRIVYEEENLGIKLENAQQVEIPEHPGINTEAFRKRISTFIGDDITNELLTNITKSIVLFMREENRPVVDVIIPEQDITHGELIILVKISKVGQISVTGNKWFTVEQIVSSFQSKQEMILDGKKIREDLNWLNKNPFRQVNLIFSEGEQPWRTDMIMEVTDKFPLRVYAGYENNGNELTGYDRYMFGFNTGKFWKWDHRLNYQYTASSDFSSIEGHSFSYVIPFPFKHSLNTYGTYSSSLAEAQGLSIAGKSWQVSSRYMMTLPSDKNYSQSLSFGVDVKKSNTNIDFGVLNLASVEISVAQLVADYEITVQDQWGYSTGMVTVFYNPGGIISNNNDEAYQLFSGDPNVSSSYLYTKLRFNRETYLPKKLQWFSSIELHETTENLIPSEQFSLGGSNSIRGFEQNSITADRGIKWINEIKFPDYQKVVFDKNVKILNSLFLDWGVGRNKSFSIEETNEFTLSSFGLNVGFMIDSYLSGQFSYAIPLETRGLNGIDRKQPFQFGVILAY